MSSRMLYSSIGAWLTVVVAITGLVAWSGVPITSGTSALAVVVGLIPPAIMVKLWGGAAPRTVAELLRESDRGL